MESNAADKPVPREISALLTDAGLVGLEVSRGVG
jgi:hypothetical protein